MHLLLQITVTAVLMTDKTPPLRFTSALSIKVYIVICKMHSCHLWVALYFTVMFRMYIIYYIQYLKLFST